MREVPFPISIALIGAPGSGKSDTALAFYEISKEFFAEHASRLDVIQNPGNHLAEKFDKPMGRWGNYADNLWLHFSRMTLEMLSLQEGQSIITCGTVLETLAYSGINIQQLSQGAQTENIQMLIGRESAATAVLSGLLMDTFRYTFGFYLPLPEKIYVPGAEIDRFPGIVDDAIKSVCSSFGVAIQVLEGSPEDKAKVMLDTISKIVETGIPEIPKEPIAAPEGEVEVEVEGVEDSESIGADSETE